MGDANCYAEALTATWGNVKYPEATPRKPWVAKNPEIHFNVKNEEEMTPEFWSKSNFPHREIPQEISTHVNTEVWSEHIQKLAEKPNAKKQTSIMKEILVQLTQGVDSGVVYPGTEATHTRNVAFNTFLSYQRR